MKLLLDTHLLIWVAAAPEKLSPLASQLIQDDDNDVFFSVASIWEVGLKRTLARDDIRLEPSLFRFGLLESGYIELPTTGDHAIASAALPDIHKDPFDRLLVAQAIVERVLLLTADERIALYPAPIRRV